MFCPSSWGLLARTMKTKRRIIHLSTWMILPVQKSWPITCIFLTRMMVYTTNISSGRVRAFSLIHIFIAGSALCFTRRTEPQLASITISGTGGPNNNVFPIHGVSQYPPKFGKKNSSTEFINLIHNFITVCCTVRICLKIVCEIRYESIRPNYFGLWRFTAEYINEFKRRLNLLST